MNYKKLREKLSVGILSAVFVIQTCFAQTVVRGPTDHSSNSSRNSAHQASSEQIVQIYNRFQTPEEMTAFVRLFIGDQEAKEFADVFQQQGISMKQSLPKLTAKGNEVRFADNGKLLFTVSETKFNEMMIEGKTLTIDPASDFLTNIKTINKSLQSPKNKTASIEALFLSSAHADSVDDEAKLRVNIAKIAAVGVVLLGVGFVTLSGVPAAIVLTIVALTLYLDHVLYNATGKFDQDQYKRLSLNCPQNGSGDMNLVLGSVHANVHFQDGFPKSYDVISRNQETTYFVEKDKNSDWQLSGLQVQGRAAEVPLKSRKYSAYENYIFEGLESMTTVCSHPEIMSKFQDLLGKAQAKLNERAPGSSQGGAAGSGSHTNQAD